MKTVILLFNFLAGVPQEHQHKHLEFKAQLTPKDIVVAKEKIKFFYERIYRDSAQLMQDSGVIVAQKPTFDEKNEENAPINRYPLEDYYTAPLFTFRMVTQGLSKEAIFKKIEQMNFYDFHNRTFAYGVLSLGNQQSLVFSCEYEISMKFQYIHLPSGNTLTASIHPKDVYYEYITFPGCLKSEIKSIDIFANPTNNSKIIGNILQNTIIYYSPMSIGDWVAVYSRYRDDKMLGYVKKSHIASFDKMPKELKKIYFKNFGC